MTRRDTSPICIEPGCDQPKYIDSAGKKFARCDHHQHEFWAAAQSARRQREMQSLLDNKVNWPALPLRRQLPDAPAPAAVPPPPLCAAERGPGGEDHHCHDCIYQEVVHLLSAKNEKVLDLVQALKLARTIRDELGI